MRAVCRRVLILLVASAALAPGRASGLPPGRGWAPGAQLVISGAPSLSGPIMDVDSLGFPRLSSRVGGDPGIVECRWADSAWVQDWRYHGSALWIPPVSTLGSQRHMIWNADTGDPFGRGQLFLAPVTTDGLGTPDSVASLVRLATEYSASVTELQRVAVVSDNDVLRLFRAPTGERWTEIPLDGGGYYGLTCAALDDTTVLVAWASSAHVTNFSLSSGLLRGSTWMPSAEVLDDGLPYSPILRRRPSGGAWLAWATNDEGVGLASYADGSGWTMWPRLTPSYAAPDGGIQHLTKWVDLSRDTAEFPAAIFSVDGLFGGSTLFVSVPTDSGFGVPEAVPEGGAGLLARIARDRFGDVWIAWWIRSGGVWWTHSFTRAEATRLTLAGTGARRLQWSLTEPAPRSWWSVLRSKNGEPFVVAATIRAGSGTDMAWTDASPGGILTYRVRRESVDARYRWESEEVRWPSKSRRPGLVALSSQPGTAVTAQFAVTDAAEGLGHVDVFDVQGRRVSRQYFESISEEAVTRLSAVVGAAPGIYFVRATDARGMVSATSRIVVLR